MRPGVWISQGAQHPRTVAELEQLETQAAGTHRASYYSRCLIRDKPQGCRWGGGLYVFEDDGSLRLVAENWDSSG